MPLGRHAVGAAQVALVGQRDPQVGRHTTEGVHQHRSTLRPPADIGGLRSAVMAGSQGELARRPYRFLLSRRWVGLLVVALLVALGCVLLGRWQLDRLGQRHERNDLLPPQPDQRAGGARRAARRRPGPARGRPVRPGPRDRSLRRGPPAAGADPPVRGSGRLLRPDPVRDRRRPRAARRPRLGARRPHGRVAAGRTTGSLRRGDGHRPDPAQRAAVDHRHPAGGPGHPDRRPGHREDAALPGLRRLRRR